MIAKSHSKSSVLAKLGLSVATLCALFVVAGNDVSAQTTISFTTPVTPEGTVVANQFGPGVYFIGSPLGGMDDSAFYGSTGENLGTWASNTDMTVTGTDVGAESPALAGIRQLHAYGNTYPGWLAENGDPSFLLDFTTAISSITVTFAGDSSGSSGIADFSGGVISDVVHVAADSDNTNLDTVTLTGLNSNNILVVPGAYGDWASVVDITFTFVPEPSTWVFVVGGAAVLGLAGFRRQRRLSLGA